MIDTVTLKVSVNQYDLDTIIDWANQLDLDLDEDEWKISYFISHYCNLYRLEKLVSSPHEKD